MDQQSVIRVRVEYSNTDGYHVFQSPDMPGLYIASSDAEKALADVSNAIKLLLELDLNVSCDVEREISIAELKSSVSAHKRNRRKVSPRRISNQSYSVRAVAA